MAIQLVAGAASQLINSSTNLNVPVTTPSVMMQQAFSVNVWINADWGSLSVPRGRKSFVGFYGLAQRTPGLAAMYWNNKDLSGTPIAIVNELAAPNINNTGTIAPASGVTPSLFSARWIGYFNPPAASGLGGYQFQLVSDDGVRLYVNSALVVDNWTDHSSATNASAGITLTPGTEVPIVLEYYNSGGNVVCQLTYRTNLLGAYAVLPNSSLNTSAPLAYTYTGMQIGTATGSGEASCWTFGGGQLVTTSTDHMADWNGKWINACYTYDTGIHKFYLNGELAGTSTSEMIPGVMKYVTINGYIGGGASETDNHMVDSYLLYNRALTPEEVLTIYTLAGGRHGIWNGLIANYEFDEAPNGSNAGVVFDLTGGGANLLMTGGGTAPKYSYTNTRADSNIRPPVSY